MSTTPRPPLLSDDEIERYSMMYTIPSRYETARALKHAKGIYEAARAKDAELIQHLLDAMSALLTNSASKKVGEEDLWALAVLDCRRAKNAAAAAGFTPTEP